MNVKVVKDLNLHGVATLNLAPVFQHSIHLQPFLLTICFIEQYKHDNCHIYGFKISQYGAKKTSYFNEVL